MLWKKMLRDLWEQKGSFFSLCVIIALGISIYISMYMTLGSLNQAIDAYYRDYHFGEVFAQVSSIPDSEAARLEDLPDVDQVTARLTREVRVLFPDVPENVYLRLISYDRLDPDGLNLPYVFSGPELAQAPTGIYLNPDFAGANGLEPGDSLPVLLDGRQQQLLVAGLAQSPEYVYAVSGKSDIFPNPALFGVAMLPREQMNQLFSISGESNSLSFKLAPGVTYDEIEGSLKNELRKYGLTELVSRENQISHFMLRSEVTSLKNIGDSVPFMMLLISTTILMITLRRRVDSQRGQIGILMAFGFTRREILWHYLSYGLIVGLTGGLLGIALGLATLKAYIGIYQTYFSIPGFEAAVFPRYLLSALGFALLSSLGACAFGCKELLKLQPAEAMRPPAPPEGRRIFLERLNWFWGWLTMSGRMAMRNLTRAPGRSLVSILGVGLVFAMMAVVFSFKNMMDIMMVDQFQKVETYDVKVDLSAYQADDKVTRELTAYPGVDLVETVLEIPGQIRAKNKSVDRAVLGLSEGARLYNLIDRQGSYVHPTGDGAVISKELADKLDLRPGSVVYLDTPLLKDPQPVVIQQIVPQYLGSNLYLEKEALWRLLGQGELVSAAMLLASPETVEAIKSDYRFSERIRGVSRPDETFAAINDYMDSYVIMLFLMGLVVSVIGFAIVYNAAMISFSERSRELASLSVLGLYDQEVAEVISFEQWILSFIGMGLGIPLAYLMSGAMASSMQTDVYSMPVMIPYSAMLLAFAATCAYLYLAQRRISGKIRTLQIVEVLKERE